MSDTRLGIFWAFSFVTLEAAQAVFFGGVFQAYDAFLVGALVFGLSALAAIVWTCLRAPSQISLAWSHYICLAGLNASTALVWITYFFALQMIEPAVVFTIFSGLLPMCVILLSWAGAHGATRVKNRIEGAGLIVMILAVGYLATVTLTGQSGFVRGGFAVAVGGLLLTCVSAGSLAAMMIYSQRLDRLGVAPVAQYSLRFPLYILIAVVGHWLGFDAKGPVGMQQLAFVVAVGFVVMAFPVFAMQKAISMVSTLKLAVFTALGPIFVFVFQVAEGRVDYAPATACGLAVYFCGAVLTAVGGMHHGAKVAVKA